MRKAASKKVLIVDDEPEICEVVSDYLLKRRRFKIYEAYDGAQALGVIEKVKPDLIILDILMPVMDGFELLKRLKGEPAYSKIPVIILTIKSEAENLDKGITLNADFYLPKPVKLENLMNFVNLVLGDK